jgi:dTDP-4-amino-4,6-dideoxygalactose transaminase
MTSVRPIPLCDLQPQYQELQGELESAIQRVLSSGQVILGPEVVALEREVAAYCGAGYSVGCGSGTDALLLALHGLEIGPGDEVIMPPFTFFATAGSVLRCGARPVFVDIEPETFNLDPHLVSRAITPRTKAIMPVHLYGQCADMAELWRIAERFDLPIIEDAAQSFGATYQGKQCGTLGAMACFSFYPTKNLATYGDAGMVVTNDPEWADRMMTLRVHGMKPKYHHGMLGWNARIDAVQAAILRVKLPHVDRFIDGRESAADRYDSLIRSRGLEAIVSAPVRRSDRRHTFNQYVVRIADGQRDALIQRFQAERIGYEVYYPVPVHLQKCLAHLGGRAGDFPISEQASREVLALPLFPEITPEQQARVIDVCASQLLMPTMRRAA